jgi:hypothetical protein
VEHTEGDGGEMFKAVCKLGLEGIVSKKLDAPYRSGPSKTWINRETVAQAKQKATQVADTAATAVSRGALFGSLALLLGAVAGWFGGRMGAVEPTITARMARNQTTGSPSGYGRTTDTVGPRSAIDAASRRTTQQPRHAQEHTLRGGVGQTSKE